MKVYIVTVCYYYDGGFGEEGLKEDIFGVFVDKALADRQAQWLRRRGDAIVEVEEREVKDKVHMNRKRGEDMQTFMERHLLEEKGSE